MSDQRLRTSQWIEAVRKNGSEVSGQFVILRYQKGICSAPQAVFIVSKMIGPAVVRNRVKRRLRELFRKKIRPAIQPGYYVFIAKMSILKAKAVELEKDILDLMGPI